ncbi:MAG: tetratricopeptide repeat protein [Deltaproteobacteria bacterium]|nr:tetratricopeptide repeat protein [Deltaproteobacteria bacterium]
MKRKWNESYELGKKAFDEKNYNEAQIYLEEVLKEKDGFADVYNMLGYIYYAAGRRSDAIGRFEKALKINPNYTEVSLNLAVIYNEMGEFDKAQGVYGKAKEAGKESATSYLDPFAKGKLANMHAEIGAIYQGLGLYKEAADEYKKAIVLRPTFVDIKNKLGIVYRDVRDYSKAVKELEEAISINPEYTPARINLGITFFTMGQVEKAKAEWLKVLHKNPNDTKAQMYMNLVAHKK